MNASCGKPGTEFASLLTSACPICIPVIPGAACCGESGPFDVGCCNADPTPMPRPMLGPFSAAVAFPPRSMPIPSSIPAPPAFPAAASSAPPSKTSGSSCGAAYGSEASSRRDTSRQTRRRAPAPLPPAPCCSGPHVARGCRAGFRARDAELVSVHMNGVMVHAQIDEPDAHAVPKPDDQGSVRRTGLAVQRQPVELHVHGVRGGIVGQHGVLLQDNRRSPCQPADRRPSAGCMMNAPIMPIISCMAMCEW